MTDSIPGAVPPTPTSGNTFGAFVRGWSGYPWILRAYILFAVFTFALTAFLPLLGGLGERAAPHITFMSPFFLFLTANQLVFTKYVSRRMTVIGVYMQVALGFVWALVDIWLGSGSQHESNPWLHHSTWRPLWTFGFPTLTLVLLLLPSTRRSMWSQIAA